MVNFTGVIEEGRGERASLTAALRVDKPRPQSLVKRKGAVISPRRAKLELMRLRAAQVGAHAASATLARCEGHWMGTKQPTLVCDIEFIPSRRERRRSTFRANMLTLAENTALSFGQDEVWLRMRGKLYRANAPGERAPALLRRGGKIIR